MVEVKESNIINAGNGVFATKNYKKYEYICNYKLFKKYNPTNIIKNHEYSIYNPLTNKSCIGDYTYNNGLDVGQFINDYLKFELNDDYRDKDTLCFKTTNENLNNVIETYIKESIKYSNVAFKDNTFKLYAIRDIDSGEELYYHYGIGYWLSHISILCDEPFTRLYCWIKSDNLTYKDNKLYFNNKLVKNYKNIIENGLKIKCDGDIVKYLKIENYDNKNKLLEFIKYITF